MTGYPFKLGRWRRYGVRGEPTGNVHTRDATIGYPFHLNKWRRYGAKRKRTRRDYWIGLSSSWFLLSLCLHLFSGYARRGHEAGPSYMPAPVLSALVTVVGLCFVLGAWNAIQLWRTRADA